MGISDDGREMDALTNEVSEVRGVNGFEDAVAFCLRRVGGERGEARTLVLSGHAFSELPPRRVWEVLEDVEHWSNWSPLHASTRRVAGESLAHASQFEQTLNLGFPVGRTTETVRVAFSAAGRHAGWEGDKGGIRTCHLWLLLERPAGGCEVINVEAFRGWSIALIKPLVARRWRHQFQLAAEHVIEATR